MIQGRGGLKNGSGGQVLSIQKEGAKSFCHAEGGHKTFWGSFNNGALSFSHIEVGGGCKRFSPLKKRGGAWKVLPCLEGGAGMQRSFFDL